MESSDSPATLFSREVKKKSPLVSRAFLFKNGGGGGNRTRVREPSGRASTYIACVLNSLFQSPAGRIPEELAYEVSPLSYKLRRVTILFF
jgi:hypothetical protein